MDQISQNNVWVNISRNACIYNTIFEFLGQFDDLTVRCMYNCQKSVDKNMRMSSCVFLFSDYGSDM